MASFDPDAPDRDSADYASYLADKIDEEERRLKLLQEKCRITTMEEQLASLRLQSSKLESKPTNQSTFYGYCSVFYFIYSGDHHKVDSQRQCMEAQIEYFVSTTLFSACN